MYHQHHDVRSTLAGLHYWFWCFKFLNCYYVKLKQTNNNKYRGLTVPRTANTGAFFGNTHPVSRHRARRTPTSPVWTRWPRKRQRLMDPPQRLGSRPSDSPPPWTSTLRLQCPLLSNTVLPFHWLWRVRLGEFCVFSVFILKALKICHLTSEWRNDIAISKRGESTHWEVILHLRSYFICKITLMT